MHISQIEPSAGKHNEHFHEEFYVRINWRVSSLDGRARHNLLNFELVIGCKTECVNAARFISDVRLAGDGAGREQLVLLLLHVDVIICLLVNLDLVVQLDVVL